MAETVFGTAAMCLLLVLPSAVLSAGPEIFLREEPETYLVIDKLEGAGLLPGLLTGDRGLETGEVSREAEKIYGAGDPFEEEMLRFLVMGMEKRYDFRLRAGPEYSSDGRVPPNSQGIPVPKNGGVRVGGFFRAAPREWLSLQGRGDLLAGFDGGSTGRVEETSLRLGGPQATLTAGRFSLWWGPGRHGSLLFTTNAEPLIGVRIRNPRPIPLGGWFRFLGLLQYDLFVARLEGSRPIPHSILSGMRLAIKPAPWLEVGVSRAMHFGGKGKDQGLSAWWKAFRGTKENDPDSQGNQIAGFDLAFILPFRAQPLKVYLEAAGEDQAEGQVIPLPTKWAFLSGIFLPSVFGSPRADFRVEFAGNHFQGNGSAWYVHGTSGEGYAHRYRGQILGHPMGTDAQDLFLEAHYFLLPSSYVGMHLDMTRRYSPGPAPEETREIGGTFVGWLTRNFRTEGTLSVTRSENQGGNQGADSTDTAIRLTVAYQNW